MSEFRESEIEWRYVRGRGYWMGAYNHDRVTHAVSSMTKPGLPEAEAKALIIDAMKDWVQRWSERGAA